MVKAHIVGFKSNLNVLATISLNFLEIQAIHYERSIISYKNRNFEQMLH